ncbi:hypothetical protein [Vibrio cyclitrophicus]|uniref:hypothetical protein n=1 Tax=Vibrio cyclitrophicus TaxID=47951 RepID=UPI0011B4A324|nr:hypothetical protein [Vibrio cyclitrophicus]
MNKLIYQELIILSDLEKTAKKFTFSPKMNLIVGKRNKVGKTSLSSTILWSMGCLVKFPPNWNKLNITTVIKFSISKENYSIKRNKNTIAIIYPDNKVDSFDSIAHFNNELATILNCKLALKSKNTGQKALAPYPSIQLMPSYIHQDTGWNGKLFNSFTDHTLYNSTEIKKAIEYFVGLRVDAYFENILSVSKLDEIKKVQVLEMEKLNYSRSIVSQYFESLTPEIISHNDDNEIDFHLSKIKSQQKKSLNLRTQIFDIESSVDLLKKAETELYDDYLYATNNLENTVDCPTCGTSHKNEIIDRFQLLNDRESILVQIESLVNKREEIREEIKSTKLQIRISEEYITKAKLLAQYPDIIENFITNNYTEHQRKLTNSAFSSVITEFESKCSKVDEQIASLGNYKDNKEVRVNKKLRLKDFKDSLLSNLEELGVYDVSEDSLSKNPHKDLDVSGSDIARYTLAYYKTLHDCMTKYCNQVSLPIIIDTPFQQEQDFENLELMARFLKNWSEKQVFIFGVDNEKYDDIRKIKTTKTFILSGIKQLLSESDYDAMSPELTKFHVEENNMTNNQLGPI